ncbi:YfiT family bacillithiol transferase [Cytobacillus sp. Hm23]
MDHLRFPDGQFESMQNITSEQCNKMIAQIPQITIILRTVVQNLSSEQLLTQYRPGGWTIQQIIHHMTDNDMNAFIRFKRALTEDTPTASTYREDLWAELSDYQIPIHISINLLESLHCRFVYLLHSLHFSAFQRKFISLTHGEMCLGVAIQRFVWHDHHHIAQIVSLKEQQGW